MGDEIIELPEAPDAEGPVDEASHVIAGMAEHLIATHGVHAIAVAEAVCTSAEAAGNQRQALIWRRIRHRVAAALQR